MNKNYKKYISIKYAQTISQEGTTELFFNNQETQNRFAKEIQSADSSVAKILNNCFSKTEKPCGFSLKVSAEPNVGANFILSVTPTSLTTAIRNALDVQYKTIVGSSINDKLKMANEKAKLGSGSGTLEIASLNLE